MQEGRAPTLLPLVCLLATCTSVPASAREPAAAAGATVYQETHWSLGVPIWIPGYRGKFAIGDIEIDGETTGGSGFFERFFDNELSINYFFMGSATFRTGRWRFQGEVFGGKFTDDVTFKLTNGNIVSAGVKPIVPNVLVEYRAREYNMGEPGEWTVQVWPYAGVRYYDLVVDATVGSLALSSANRWADPIVGVWVPLYLRDHWTFEAEANLGGFGIGSRLSWQVQGLVSYRFSSLFSLSLGFSVLDVDYRGTAGSKEFAFKSTVLGPRLSVAFDF